MKMILKIFALPVLLLVKSNLASQKYDYQYNFLCNWM